MERNEPKNLFLLNFSHLTSLGCLGGVNET